jgi:hypothetical protein
MGRPAVLYLRDEGSKARAETDDIELYPDAMERLERAIKIAARHPPIKRPATHDESTNPRNRALLVVVHERQSHLTR